MSMCKMVNLKLSRNPTPPPKQEWANLNLNIVTLAMMKRKQPTSSKNELMPVSFGLQSSFQAQWGCEAIIEQTSKSLPKLLPVDGCVTASHYDYQWIMLCSWISKLFLVSFPTFPNQSVYISISTAISKEWRWFGHASVNFVSIDVWIYWEGIKKKEEHTLLIWSCFNMYSMVVSGFPS